MRIRTATGNAVNENGPSGHQPATGQRGVLRKTVWVMLIAGLIGLLSGGESRAQSESVPLQLEIRNQDKLRSNAPASIEVSLVWNGPVGMQGTLELQLRDRTIHFGTAYLPDIALVQGRNPPVRVMLPTIDGQNAEESVDLIARFITDKAEYDLGSRPLRVGGFSQRVFRVLHCDSLISRIDPKISRAMHSMRLEEYWRALALEQFDRQEKKGNPPDEVEGMRPDDLRLRQPPDFETILVHLQPAQLDDDPHWYCGYNIVVLRESGLSSLRQRELDAIRQWVRAGGSVCVEATGLLETQHLEFLNGLAGSGDQAHFHLNPDGRIEKPDGRDFELIRSGLGNAAVLYESMSGGLDPESDEWKQLVVFLWKFRQDQRQAVNEQGYFTWLNMGAVQQGDFRQRQVIIQNGRQQVIGMTQPQNQNWMPGQSTPTVGFQAITSGEGFLQTLMPSEVEIVPVQYIALILILYVIAIGPLDYFVLGALRIRRFTWITFPTMTLAFTLVTVWLSNSYLSSSTERTYASIMDIGDDGSVLRENRFELLYTASSHDVVTELNSSIFTPILTDRFGANVRYDRYGQAMGVEARVTPPALVGRPPGRYDVTQTVPQWTPQINRIFSIAPQIKLDAEFDWLRHRDLSQSAEMNQLHEDVRSAFGGNAQTIIFSGGRVASGDSKAVFQKRYENYYYYDEEERSNDFLSDICLRQQGIGLFSIVSKVAPHGGDNFEDLTLVDPTDPGQWLVVVVVKEETGMKLFRRLYRNEETAS